MLLPDALPALALTFVPLRTSVAKPHAGDGALAIRARYTALLRQESRKLDLAVRTDTLVRDLDLLVALDRRHTVTIRMLLAALDERVARRLEGSAPGPADRLAAVAALAAEGLDTRVVLSPLRAGINDGAAALRRFVEAAREAGATDVELGPETHRGLLGRRSDRPAAPHVRSLFERLRLEYGFPRAHAGRG